jgi:HD-GYP domain-containing protein (c-di-GMP phosphodiesterase class II)
MARKALTVAEAKTRRTPTDREAAELTSWQSHLLTQLSRWFTIEFHLVDGDTGDLVHCAFDQAARDWGARGELCRAIAAGGMAALIEEEGPLLVMGLPVQGPGDTNLVAVGTFVCEDSASAGQASLAGEMLGLEPDDAEKWIGRQTCWPPDLLLRMGQLATERLVADRRLRQLEREAKDLSRNVSTSYEEISLLYRLTQNLKLSSNREELGKLALQWLAETLPVESLAIQYSSSSKLGAVTGDDDDEPVLLTYGPCPVSGDEVTRIIETLELDPSRRLVLINRATTLGENWQWPAVRELIIVPLSEGANSFGWLVALNHARGEEFGMVETSLLSSVGTILGIHSGNAELYRQQRELFAGVVQAITCAIDAKDPYTCGHSDRVARVAVCLAQALGCDAKELDTIYLSGLLHDVGKIGIDDQVLRKPGKLTVAEYDHIKTHSEIGHRILSDIKQLDEVWPVVLHHHERWDGNGYPRGLAGEAIPFLARIIAVADSFDAMSSDRPYRSCMADEQLDAILREGAGTQWDPRVVDAFFRMREEIREIGRQPAEDSTPEQRDWI